MNKAEKKKELQGLMINFFETKVLTEAGRIKEQIKSEVLNLLYSKGILELLTAVIPTFTHDMGSYFVSFEHASASDKKQAYLALVELINFVDLSQLKD
jgi:hypothetical protein